MPALVLIYSLIDSIAWAAAKNRNAGVRNNFEQWVTEWLLPELSANLTATDLYAARCAVLHTLTGTSDLFSKGAAKRIIYAWGAASADILQSAITDCSLTTNHIAIHYDDLHGSLNKAINNFFTFADSNPILFARLEDAAQKHYANI
ncbi:MAG: hypothetical protein ABL911_03490 [Gallionella sp.]